MSAHDQQFYAPAGYQRLFLILAWDGLHYAGWQSQPNQPSVQDTVYAAACTLLGRQGLGRPVLRPVAAGRTDAGVHAEAMPIHLDVPLESTGLESTGLESTGQLKIPIERLARALNSHLPPTISVLSCRVAPLGLHARFSCLERRYIYRLLCIPQRHPLWVGRALHVPYALDAELMNQAALNLIGTHDFAAFATQEDRQTVRELRQLEVKPLGQIWEIHVTGESFLRHMVRGLVGTLLQVGQGRISPADLSDILASGSRAQAGGNVPSYGLYFAGAKYLAQNI